MSKKKTFNDRPFSYHKEVELSITTLTNLGLGLGRVALGGPDAERGWVVMVAFALPGERVRARVFRNHANYSEADLVEVISASPHRIPPRCPLFGRCGGCQYQNLRYEEQLGWKRRQVGELMEHMAGLKVAVAPVIGSPRPFGYRSKITPHFNLPAPGRELSIGFLRQGSRTEVVDVPRCEIATEPINARLSEAREAVRRRAGEGALTRGATLLFRDSGGIVTTRHEDRVVEEVPVGPGETLRLGFLARDFFQNNPFILPAFAGYVREQARSSGARFLVDAYCGSGLLALASAGAFERVVGVEVSESSVAFARDNAAANGIANASFTAGDASAIFSGLGFPGRDTAVVIDPPRKGCDGAFLGQLFAFRPRAVVYVSCDPATQMRDLAGFLAAGYAVGAVQPFDLFPQTRHLECVITLSLGAGDTGAR
ncbi:MAG TPA: class I SAM-dependent RNA methyltransferase [Opitutaceae bacterium]|nr:class I SAM-dependent RNA methyltransferase [Opitutaceae bacterium]